MFLLETNSVVPLEAYCFRLSVGQTCLYKLAVRRILVYIYVYVYIYIYVYCFDKKQILTATAELLVLKYSNLFW
jgi:hypothetical protein